MTNVHRKSVPLLIFRYCLTSGQYGRSCFLVNLENLSQLKCYLDYIHLLSLSPHPSLVILVLILVSKLHLGKPARGFAGTLLGTEQAPRADEDIDKKKSDGSYELTDAERKEKTQAGK